MSFAVFVLTVFSVTLSACAQIMLKFGMSAPSVRAALAGSDMLAKVQAVAFSPFVVGGLAVYFLGALVWLTVLSRIDVSQAYPFVGMGFVLTLLFAWLFLGEHISASRLFGASLILAGIVFVARS
ncbi:SMR family transporter [Pikeienuella sp. HZG-20]|uniref:SMR family transporter n=1 Tax=Paludibacillus litoralis TaxID=3133267 RepID=UPI0030EDD979